jgi:hypothetical protein
VLGEFETFWLNRPDAAMELYDAFQRAKANARNPEAWFRASCTRKRITCNLYI